jgi:hemerythrin
MEMLDYVWEESMRTGDELCDDQHKELIRRLNLLLHAMHHAQPAEQVESMLAFLDTYVAAHFTHEEACMDRYHCPLAETNRRAHGVFVMRFRALRDEWTSQSSTTALVAVKMLRDLSAWLVDHIRTIDARMLPYVQ